MHFGNAPLFRRKLANDPLQLTFQRRLGRGQPCDGDPVWRTGDIAEPDFLTKYNGLRVAAMLAADAYFEVWTDRAGTRNADFHELADRRVERHKRIVVNDLLVCVLA